MTRIMITISVNSVSKVGQMVKKSQKMLPTMTRKRKHMLMMRILGPIITFVNRSWKVSLSKTKKLLELIYIIDVSRWGTLSTR